MPEMNFDIGMVVLASLALFTFMFVGKKRYLERWQGVFFVIAYLTYIIFTVVKG